MNFLAEAEEIKDEIIQIRHFIHQNPELSFSEYKTSKIVAKILKESGIEVREGIAGTGVLGILRGNKEGKTLAIRADMDALPLNEETGLDYTSINPGVMHACGHDIHTAVLLGTARLLSRKRDVLKGTIKFIFQPGEEKLTGALKMVGEGILKEPAVDAIIALHCWPDLPAGTIGARKGALLSAADTIKIVVKGRSGHAAHPHKCIDPIVISGHIITALQTIISREVSPIEPAVITIGKIQGGTTSNIIASQVELLGTVRTTTTGTRKKMPDIINRVVRNIAESMNGEAKVNYLFGPAPVINNNALVALLEETATATIGKEKYIELSHPSLGSEDFAFYLEKVPGMMFRLGTANENYQSKLALHNPQIIFDDDSLKTGISIMSDFAVRYLNSDR